MNGNWSTVLLNNIADVIDSLHQTPSYSKTGYPMVRVTDIKPGFLNLDNCLQVDRAVFQEFTKKHTPTKGDIVFSRVGSEGIVSLVKSNQIFCLGQNTAFIVPKEKNNFLYYWLNSYIGKSKIKAKTTGASQRTISLESIKTLEINTPTLSEQEMISSIIYSYDELIENNERRIHILEEIVQRLYAEWFVKFRFPGFEKTKKTSDIPEGWEYKSISEVARVVRGTSYSSEQISDNHGDYYLVNLKSFNRGGGFRYDGEKYFSGKITSDQLLIQGDIVVAVTDMTTDRAVIARPARIPNIKSNKITFSADVVKIISEKIPLVYIYYSLLDYRFTETTKNKANGANVLHLKPQAISEYKILIPSEGLLEKFEKSCLNIVKLSDKLFEENEKLTKMRDLLIPQLISGKRELKSVDNVKSDKKDVYKDAVLIAEIVKTYNENNFYPNHLRLVKTEYFVQRFINQNPLQKYQEHMLGPYDSKSTYAGGEKVSKAKKYIEKKGSNFYAGTKIRESEKYFKNEKASIGSIVDYLKGKTNDDLELLTTIDYIIYKKLLEKTRPTAQIILDYIHNSSVWEQKIKRLSITEQKVEEMMEVLRNFALKGLPYPSLK